MLVDALRGGLRTAQRQITFAPVFAMGVALICVVVTVSASQLIDQFDRLNVSRWLREQNAVAFTTSFPPEEPLAVTPEAEVDLVGRIESGRAYTMILGNGLGMPEPSAETLAVVFGDPPSSVLDGVPDCVKPCALRAEHPQPGTPTEIQLGDNTIRATGTFPDDARAYDPRLEPLPLQGRLVLRLPASWIPLLHEFPKEEAFTRVVFNDPSASEVDSYVDMMARAGAYMTPAEIAVTEQGNSDDVVALSGSFLLGALALLAVSLMAAAQVFIATARAEVRGFRIRYQCGSPSWVLFVRVFAYLFAVSAVLPVCLLVPLSLVFQGTFARAAFGSVMALVAGTIVGSLVILRTAEHSQGMS